jgi:hypothetical protein
MKMVKTTTATGHIGGDHHTAAGAPFPSRDHLMKAYRRQPSQRPHNCWRPGADHRSPPRAIIVASPTTSISITTRQAPILHQGGNRRSHAPRAHRRHPGRPRGLWNRRSHVPRVHHQHRGKLRGLCLLNLYVPTNISIITRQVSIICRGGNRMSYASRAHRRHPGEPHGLCLLNFYVPISSRKSLSQSENMDNLFIF